MHKNTTRRMQGTCIKENERQKMKNLHKATVYGRPNMKKTECEKIKKIYTIKNLNDKKYMQNRM